MTYTKAELVTALESDLGLEKLVAKDLVDQLFEEIRIHLENGEEVKLSGFGNFEMRDKAARPGRNPKTKVPKIIAARRVVTFKAGQKLKAKIQVYKGPEILLNTQTPH